MDLLNSKEWLEVIKKGYENAPKYRDYNAGACQQLTLLIQIFSTRMVILYMIQTGKMKQQEQPFLITTNLVFNREMRNLLLAHF